MFVGDQLHRIRNFSEETRRWLTALSDSEGLGQRDWDAFLSDTEHLSRLAVSLEAAGILQVSDGPFRAAEDLGQDRTACYYDAVLATASPADAIANQHILVVGCGGIGGEVAQHMVASGCRRLTLVDGDNVHSSNLNRQYLFRTSDIGRPKVDVACEHLAARAPGLQVDTHQCYIEGPGDLPGLGLMDVSGVICAADTPQPSIWSTVSSFAEGAGALFSVASVGIFRASWGPLIRPEESRLHSLWRDACRGTGAEPLVPSFGPTNSFAAAALARDFIHALLNGDALSAGARVHFDFRSGKTIVDPLDRSSSIEQPLG